MDQGGQEEGVERRTGGIGTWGRELLGVLFCFQESLINCGHVTHENVHLFCYDQVVTFGAFEWGLLILYLDWLLFLLNHLHELVLRIFIIPRMTFAFIK